MVGWSNTEITENNSGTNQHGEFGWHVAMNKTHLWLSYEVTETVGPALPSLSPHQDCLHPERHLLGVHAAHSEPYSTHLMFLLDMTPPSFAYF